MLLSRRVVFISFALLAGQATLLVAAPQGRAASLTSSLLGIALNAFVVAACYQASRRAGRFGRELWLLMSFAISIWLCGSLFFTYYSDVLQAPLATFWPSAILFFLFPAPIVAALLLDETKEMPGINWEQTLDLAQIGILAVTAFLLFFYIPSLSHTAEQILVGQALKLHIIRDALLVAAFALRTVFSRSHVARSLYGRISVFLLVYGATSISYFYGRGFPKLPVGLLDLISESSLVVLMLLAATWNPAQQEAWTKPKAKFRMDTAWVQVLSWLFPFLILSMAPRIPFDMIVVCVIAAFASLICAVSRIGVTVHNEKKATGALRASEERFSKAFHFSPIPMGILRARDKKLVDVNDAILRQFGGYTREEAIGSSGVELGVLVHPEQRAVVLDRLQKSGSVRDVEVEYRRKSGEIMFALVSGTMIEIEGEPCILWVTQDITDRKEAGEKLRASEERFSKAFHASPVAMVISRHGQGQIIDVNRTWLLQNGFSREEVMGRTAIELNLWVHPEERGGLVQRLENEGSVNNAEIVVRKKSGETRIELISAEKIELEGQPCILWVTQDITNQKEAEEKLRVSEERFSKAFQSSPVAMGISQPGEGKMIDVNNSWLRQSGFTREEVLGHKSVELNLWVHPEERNALVNRLVKEGAVRDVEIAVRKKSGETRVGLISAETIELEGKPCVLWVTQDITAQKEAAEKLRVSEERFSKAFHSSPIPMTILRLRDKTLVDVNEAMVRLTGYQREEGLGSSSVELGAWVHPEERAIILGRLEKGETVRDVEMEYRRKSGEKRFALIAVEQMELEGEACLLWVAQDITDRKQAEEKLRASEERFSKAFDSSPSAMAIVRLSDGKLIDVNSSLLRQGGYSREEVLGQSVAELDIWVNPENRAAVIERLKNEGSVQGVEISLQRKSGEVRIAMLSAAMIELGGDPCILWAFQDVTSLKEATEKLRVSEERFLKAFQSNPICMSISRLADGKLIDVNGAWLLQSGFSREEVQGRTVVDLNLWARPEDRENLIGRLESQGSVRDVVVPVRRRFGGTRTERVAAEIIELEGERCVLWVSQDISAQMDAEEKLRASEEHFSKAFHLSPHAMTISRLEDGRYLEVNDRWLQWSNFTREQMIGRSSVELGIWSAEERANYARELKEHGFVRNLEVTFHFGSKEPFVCLLSSELIELKGEQCILTAIQDIVERKKLEEQLRQSQKMEAVGLLAGGVAHDFNNLLGVILGYADLIAEQVASQRELCEEVEQIRSAAERAASLTKQLLAFSRRQLLKPKVLDLNGVVTETERLLRRLIGEHIVLVTRLAPKLERVKADRAQIEQVIMNLAVNARDAMPLGGTLTIETSNAELDAEYARQHVGARPGRYVMLAMSDTGIGMDTETQARVFEPFFTTKEAGKGTGLGLATVYGIVKQSGGSIWLYSEVGRGTTFKVYLPEVDEPLESTIAEKRAAPMAKGTEMILLVEDEDALRNLVFDYLRRTGYSVLAARNAQEALERSRGANISLILTDVVLPGVSGPELARQVRELHPSAKVVFVSGYTDGAMAQHDLIEHGATLLHKPFRMPELGRTIREVLDTRID
jgi:PAS domain S-box-containing protein